MKISELTNINILEAKINTLNFNVKDNLFRVATEYI